MKIFYLFLDGTRSPGVIRKVKSKIRALNELGLDVTGLFMNRGIEKYSFNSGEKIIYLPLQIKPLPFIFNRRFIRNFKTHFQKRSFNKQFYAQLEGELEKHSFDLLLFRYPLSNRFLFRFAKKFRNKIVFEHNSKELVEMKLDLAANPGMQYSIDAEEQYGPLVLSCARALTGVGNEITAYEVSRVTDREIRHTTIPNGIDVKPLPVRTAPQYSGQLKLLFVTGSPSPWVGIDLLIAGLKNYKGSVPITLCIVGPVSDELTRLVEESGIGKMVELTGEKHGTDLDRYFNECHIAIGTLAMQRVGLSEHSSLKVLEYASRGIPFVISYEETNFSAIEGFQPFYRNIGYNNRDVNVEQIVSFANEVLLIPDHADRMRKLAEQHLDFSHKMKKLKLFIESLGNES